MTGATLVNETTTPEAMPEEIATFSLGGRYFQTRKQTTERQDSYLAIRIEASGLEELKEQLGPDGSMTDLAIGIIKRAYKNDLLYEIVGALFTEVDANGTPLPLFDDKGRKQKWTIEKAEEIGNFIANIDDPKEKEILNPIINAVIILFFTTGVGSLTTSPSSSEAAPTDSQDNPISFVTPRPAGSSVAAPNDALLARVLAEGDLDPTITGSGTPRSAPSPDTTRTK